MGFAFMGDVRRKAVVKVSIVDMRKAPQVFDRELVSL